MKYLGRRFEQWAVRILCAIALVSVGFAHQVPAAAASPSGPADYSAYALPDGSLPTLCVTVTDETGKSQHGADHNHGCEACRISATAMLPSPADLSGAPLGYAVAEATPLRAAVFHRDPFPPNTGPRAPPTDPAIA
jgi:hypothetical protein